MKAASGKLKRDLYERKFEIIDLRAELKTLREQYDKVKKRLMVLLKEEEEQEKRDAKDIANKRKGK